MSRCAGESARMRAKLRAPMRLSEGKEKKTPLKKTKARHLENPSRLFGTSARPQSMLRRDGSGGEQRASPVAAALDERALMSAPGALVSWYFPFASTLGFGRFLRVSLAGDISLGSREGGQTGSQGFARGGTRRRVLNQPAYHQQRLRVEGHVRSERIKSEGA